MSFDPVVNFAKVIVSTGYAASVTSIVLETGHGAKLPDPSVSGAFNLVWWDSTTYSNPTDDPGVEIVRVTARTSDTLTIIRAQESTSDVNHNTNGKVYRMILAITKKVYDDLAAGVYAIGRFTTGIYDNAVTPVLSIDTGNRILYASDGADIILNYNTPGLADFINSNVTTTGLGTFNQFYVSPTTLPSAPASASGAFEYSGDPDYFYTYYDYEYTHQIRVYAYKETTAGKLWSATYAESAVITDAGTYSQTYRINWTWTAVTGATGYRVFNTDSYSGMDFSGYVDVLTNSYTDDNANSGWPNSGYAVDVNLNYSFKATNISLMDYLFINTTSPDAYSSKIVVDGQIGATTFTASGGYKDGSTTILDYVGGSVLIGGAGNLTLTGSRSILAGYNSGLAMTSGQDDFFAGAYSGLANTTGSNNFFMGYYAGGENTIGSNAVYIGSQCGQRSTASGNTYNVAIGSNAYNCGIIGGASGTLNTIIGASAGGLTSGSSDVMIGYYAGHYQTTASNILLIDNQSRTNAAGELTNSLIYGVFNATVASQSLTINAGNVYLPYDNEALWFGTGLDSKMYYDGTDLIVNPEVVGTGALVVKSATLGSEKLNNVIFDGNSDAYWTAGTGWYAGSAYVFTVTGATPTLPSIGSTWKDSALTVYTCRYYSLSGGAGYIVMTQSSYVDPATATGTLTRLGGTGTSPISYSAWVQSASHASTGTGTLTQPILKMVTPIGIGEPYVLTYTLSNVTVGGVTPSCGGVTLTARTVAGTYTEAFTPTTSTDVLTFTPSATTARFVIDDVSLKKYSGDLTVNGNFRTDKFMCGTGINDDTVSDMQVQGLSTYHKGTGIVTLGTPVATCEQIAGTGSFTGINYFAFSVYAYWDTPYGFRVYSQAGSCDITTIAAPDPYDLRITWNAVTNADGYVVVIDNDDVNGFYGDVYVPHAQTGTDPIYTDYLNGEAGSPVPTMTYTSPYTLNVALNVLGELWVDETFRVGDTLTLGTHSIIDSDGYIDFSSNNLYMTGTMYSYEFVVRDTSTKIYGFYGEKSDSGSDNWMFYNNTAYNNFNGTTTSQLQFRDSAIYIHSEDDGHLDLTADIQIDFNTPNVQLDKLTANTIYDTDNILAFDIGNRNIYNESGNLFIDIDATLLYDTESEEALDWNARYLYAANGSTVIECWDVGLRYPTITIYTSTPNTIGDYVVTVICNSSSAMTVNLPVASGSGRCLTIKNINTGSATIDGNSSDTIDGDTTMVLGQWDGIQIVDYAANKWVII